MTILNNIAKWIAAQLDKLKVASPYVFLLIQLALASLVKLFVDNTINIPTPKFITDVFEFLDVPGLTDLDSLVMLFLGALVISISPRTSKLAAIFNEEKLDKKEDKLQVKLKEVKQDQKEQEKLK